LRFNADAEVLHLYIKRHFKSLKFINFSKTLWSFSSLNTQIKEKMYTYRYNYICRLENVTPEWKVFTICTCYTYVLFFNCTCIRILDIFDHFQKFTIWRMFHVRIFDILDHFQKFTIWRIFHVRMFQCHGVSAEATVFLNIQNKIRQLP
jgi:hypothetical protein